MRTLSKALILLFGAMLVTRLAALIVSRRLDEGTEVSDEVRRVVLFDGLDFESRAGGLRNAEISVVMGSARLDLRHADIDPRLNVQAITRLGGTVITTRDPGA